MNPRSERPVGLNLHTNQDIKLVTLCGAASVHQLPFPVAMPRANALNAAPLANANIQPLMKALADPLRMDVALALANGERCVCELTETLGLAQSRLSFHLKVMRQAGLIRAREEGRWVYYKLEPEALEQMREWLAGLEILCRTPACPCP